MPTREAIFSALFALVSGITWTSIATNAPQQFITTSRRVKLFSDVIAQQQPSLFQAEHDEQLGQVTNLPYKNTMGANWIIFQNVCADPNQQGAIENNLILDQVMAALAPVPSDPGFRDKRNTLGGLVHHCYVSGRLFKDPGDIDGQGMMVVPIKILVP